MIKSTLKTLSFSFATLALAAGLQASEQTPASDRAAADARVGCATQAEIDLGWDEQLALVEKRLAEKESEGTLVMGAIISAPFETFAPYRTDVPPEVSAVLAAKSPRRVSTDQVSRD